MNIRFYKNFSKRKNSTKRPSASDNYNDINCYLKEDTSIDNPSIVLSNREGNMSQTGNPITTSHAIASNANSCSVSFTPIQDTSGGDPSPSNPCAITGRTEINLNVNGNIINVPFGETVYGGTCNVTGGGVINKYNYLDLGSLTWTLNGVRFYSQINVSVPSAPYAPDGDVFFIANACCVEYAITNRANIESLDYHFSIHRANLAVYITIHDERFTDANAFRTAMSGVYICYELATPTTISTSAHVVPLNKGTNTLSANADSITINYDISNIGDLPLNYTYAYIDHFKKYYFVSAPIILTDGTIQYDLVEDTLATNKSAVGTTKAQIVYSSTGYNKHIVDTRMSVKANKVYFNRQTQASGFNSTGCYIIGVINDESSGKYGAASYYLMTQSQLKDLIECLSSTDINAQIAQYFSGDWMQFIASCIWIPVSYSDALSWFTGGLVTTTRIKVGSTGLLNSQAIEAKGTPLTSTLHDFTSVSLSIPYKWQDFRDCEPYTSASLYLVGLGDTDININDFYSSTNVSIQYRIDAVTGDITYRIYNDDGTVVKTVMFNGGVNVVLSNTAIQTGGVLTTVGGLAASAAGIGLSAVTGNIAGVVGSGIAAMGAGASILMNANHRSTSIKGTNQGRSSFADTSFILTICSLDTENIDAADYIARWGRPVGEVGTISSYSGYVQCEGASVAIAGDTWERDEINSYLNSGFYYE